MSESVFDMISVDEEEGIGSYDIAISTSWVM